MKAAIDKIRALRDGESNAQDKAELSRALEILLRSQNATPTEDRVDMRNPDYKQIANEPEKGENAFAERNRLDGPKPENSLPANTTPPPVETPP